MITSGMFTSGYGTGGLESFVDVLTGDLIIIVPIALGVMATLWGVRLALKYFKGIAR